MSITFTKEERAKVETGLLASLADGKRATFMELVGVADRTLGSETCYRFVDAWLQKQRKAGVLTFDRVGRSCMWRLVAKETA